jgi:hypothetical protein
MGFNLALRKLGSKKFVRVDDMFDEQDGQRYDGVAVTEARWNWIEENETRFVLHRHEKK